MIFQESQLSEISDQGSPTGLKDIKQDRVFPSFNFSKNESSKERSDIEIEPTYTSKDILLPPNV